MTAALSLPHREAAHGADNNFNPAVRPLDGARLTRFGKACAHAERQLLLQLPRPVDQEPLVSHRALGGADAGVTSTPSFAGEQAR
jgi:hypothetical protein